MFPLLIAQITNPTSRQVEESSKLAQDNKARHQKVNTPYYDGNTKEAE